MITKKIIPYPELLKLLPGINIAENEDFFILKTKNKARIFIRKKSDPDIKGIYVSTQEIKMAARLKKLSSGKSVLNLSNDRYFFFLDENAPTFSEDLMKMAESVSSPQLKE